MSWSVDSVYIVSSLDAVFAHASVSDQKTCSGHTCRCALSPLTFTPPHLFPSLLGVNSEGYRLHGFLPLEMLARLPEFGKGCVDLVWEV